MEACRLVFVNSLRETTFYEQTVSSLAVAAPAVAPPAPNQTIFYGSKGADGRHDQ